MTTDAHGRDHHAAGSPASTGGQYAPQPTPAAAAALITPRDLSDNDRTHLTEHRLAFRDGYTPEDVNRVLGAVDGLDLRVVWDSIDNDGFGGGSEMIGRTPPAPGAPAGPWLHVTGDFYDWMHEPDTDLTDLPDVLDTDSPYERQDIDDLPGDDFSNAAAEDETYDVDEAVRQLIEGGYSASLAREIAESSSSYDTAAEIASLAREH